ncbi:MAG: ATP-binding cassette domain-containing protein [Gemmatimonadota bacterium]|nr:ATP-binding cassette domain-containing protein [Gemmatimonadota bacterium]
MRAEAAQATVEFRDVRIALGGAPVLAGIDLDIRPGETLVLLGRSGSGKSTALKLVNALLLPDAGDVLVGGRPVRAWDPIELRRSTGYILQQIGLFPHFTVARNIGLVPRLLGWTEADIAARVEELLSLTGLETALSGRYPRQLSGGQRQRVGIARALAGRPELILCDEPFGALDPVTRFDLQREFRTLAEKLGTTLFFVTHDVREALLLADRIAFLADGKLRFAGTPSEFRAVEDPVVARFRDAAA